MHFTVFTTFYDTHILWEVVLAQFLEVRSLNPNISEFLNRTLIFYIIYCIEKSKRKRKKRPGMAHIKIRTFSIQNTRQTLGSWWWSSGQRARLLSDNPSSNPAEIYSFLFCKLFEKDKMKQNMLRMDHLCKKIRLQTFKLDREHCSCRSRSVVVTQLMEHSLLTLHGFESSHHQF